MTDAEINALARALITASGDDDTLTAVIRSLPDPFPHGGRLIACLAFVARDALNTAAAAIAAEFGQTADEITDEYFAKWAAWDLRLPQREEAG